MVPPRCTPRVVVASRHDHHRPTDMTTPIELHPDMKKAELDRFLADAFGIKSNPFERPPAIAFFFTHLVVYTAHCSYVFSYVIRV